MREEEILPLEDYQLWTEYLDKEVLGLKKESKELLNQFISRFSKYNSIKLGQTVLAICDNRNSGDERINHLLFKEIILPNLLENCEKLNPDYHRLLATFEQSILSDKRLSKNIAD